MSKRTLLLCLPLLSAGCATTQTASEPAAAEAVGQSLAQNDPVLQIAQTIDIVSQAELAGSITALDYLSGLRTLRTAGARMDDGAGENILAYETQWLAAARALNPAAAIPPLRGRALGPAYKRGTVSPGERQVTTQLFLAGKKARVALAGPASSISESMLRLEIRQSDGDPVCVRPSGTASKGCEWIPLFSGRYEITLSNSGPSMQNYTLISN